MTERFGQQCCDRALSAKGARKDMSTAVHGEPAEGSRNEYSREDSAKRRQILDGARRAFLTNGFDAASMNEIARAAGGGLRRLDLRVEDLHRPREIARRFEVPDEIREGRERRRPAVETQLALLLLQHARSAARVA